MLSTEISFREPNARTLRKFIKNERIEFAGKEWQESFENYLRASRKRHFLRDRLVFADAWMKVMQEQLERGVLDPHHAYEKTKRIIRIKPNPTEGKFIFGVVCSHWKYGPDFLRVTSEDGNYKRQKDDLAHMRERYKYYEDENSFF